MIQTTIKVPLDYSTEFVIRNHTTLKQIVASKNTKPDSETVERYFWHPVLQLLLLLLLTVFIWQNNIIFSQLLFESQLETTRKNKH